ncbi:phosphotransferase [Kribbella sp. NPDC058245]|uniref:phosphotransferase n=1 Tax=Kribbella sp. NPDC058245 TaxID=3346399 RepID=UPI0036E9A326
MSDDLNQRLRYALAGICKEAELDTDDAQLVKYTNNAVYILPRENAVVRFGIGNLASQRAQHVTRIAEWLDQQGAPAVRLSGTHNPILFENYSATIWEQLEASNPAWHGADLAAALRGWRSLSPPDWLKDWDPFSKARASLAMADGLPPEDHSWLSQQWAEIEALYGELYENLHLGLLHGDAYIGNLLRRHDGQFVLCDFDETSVGPLDYDLVVAAVSAVRFGANRDHEELASTLGVDVTESPSWPVLRRIRELVLVTSVIPDLSNRPDIARVHAHRLATLRTGEDELWQRYK